MDTGGNSVLLQMSVESIAEVKVLDLELPGRIRTIERAAGHRGDQERHEQVRGSDVRRRAQLHWNANSKTNILNGDPKAVLRERDLGYSLGGPVGKPGGKNKLFFFYSQEFKPRTSGNNVVRYRMPTALERNGDFSQSYDNNGNLYPTSRIRCCRGPAARPIRPPASGWGRRGPHPGQSPVFDRAGGAQHVAAAEHHRRRSRLQLRTDPAH